MLAGTHGQPFADNIKRNFVFGKVENQLELLNEIPWQGKFGGAVGNMNAHYVAYPDLTLA